MSILSKNVRDVILPNDDLCNVKDFDTGHNL